MRTRLASPLTSLARRTRLVGLACVAALASAGGVGCSDDTANTNDAGAGPDSGVAITCQKDPRVDTYVANLTKPSASGAIKVTLLSSDPGPPIRGTNKWALRVTDAGGNPISNAAITLTPLMPDHGHGSSVKPTIVAQADGKYDVTNLYFFMPGVWKVTVTAPAPGGAPESTEFLFCVAG